MHASIFKCDKLLCKLGLRALNTYLPPITKTLKKLERVCNCCIGLTQSTLIGRHIISKEWFIVPLGLLPASCWRGKTVYIYCQLLCAIHFTNIVLFNPYNLKHRDSAHFTDEATEDNRKEVTCLVTQSWDSIWIPYPPVLPSLSPLLQVLGRYGHLAVEGNIV